MLMKLCNEQYVLKPYNVYINDDPELILIHFKTMSKLAKLVSVLTVGPDIRGALQDYWSFGLPKYERGIYLGHVTSILKKTLFVYLNAC